MSCLILDYFGRINLLFGKTHSSSLPNAANQPCGFLRRLNLPGSAAMLCRMQQELDFHSFEWKNDAPVVGAIEDAGV
jgi:hypothetical protein